MLTPHTGALQPIGSVRQLNPGQGNVLSIKPCEAGQTVGYQMDALSGLDLQYFQMVMPPTGLFVTVSD